MKSSKEAARLNESVAVVGAPEWLALSKVKDVDIQVRVKLDPQIVAEYAGQIQENALFPPIDVFFDGKDYHVAGGLHRLAATCKEKCKDILAVVHKGIRQDAVWFALGANKTHGLRMNRADTRKAMGLTLELFAARSSRDIAKQIGCSHVTVADERQVLESTGQIVQLEKTIGADDKLRPAKRKTKPTPVKESDDVLNDGADEPNDTAMADVPPDPDKHDAGTATEQPVEQEAKPVGRRIAAQAVGLLRTIPTDDAELMHAISLISAWLIEVKTASGSGESVEGPVSA